VSSRSVISSVSSNDLESQGATREDERGEKREQRREKSKARVRKNDTLLDPCDAGGAIAIFFLSLEASRGAGEQSQCHQQHEQELFEK